jgi:hypothetical protein
LFNSELTKSFPDLEIPNFSSPSSSSLGNDKFGSSAIDKMIESSHRLAPTESDYDMDVRTPASGKGTRSSNAMNGLEKDLDESHESNNMDSEDVDIDMI